MIIDTDEHPIAVSILYYTFFLSAGSVLRGLIRTYVPRRHQTYWLDLVTTFSVLACSLENSHVRVQYGYGAYIAVLYMLVTWYSMTLFDSNPNPVYNVVAFAQGKYDLARVLWLMTAQVLGAWLSYQAALIFWSLGLCADHRKRFETVECTTDLSVSAPVGFLIESSGTALDIFLSLCVFTSSPQIELAVKCLVLCLLTAAAIHLTGFYLNPVNASNQSIGCTGTSLPVHLFVYWVGPIVSAYITTCAVPHLRKLLQIEMDLKSDNNVTTQKKTKHASENKGNKEREDEESSDDSSDAENDNKTTKQVNSTLLNSTGKAEHKSAKTKSSKKLKKS